MRNTALHLLRVIHASGEKPSDNVPGRAGKCALENCRSWRNQKFLLLLP